MNRIEMSARSMVWDAYLTRNPHGKWFANENRPMFQSHIHAARTINPFEGCTGIPEGYRFKVYFVSSEVLWRDGPRVFFLRLIDFIGDVIKIHSGNEKKVGGYADESAALQAMQEAI